MVAMLIFMRAWQKTMSAKRKQAGQGAGESGLLGSHL